MAKDYLFEIGTEEMPAHVVPRSVKQLADRTRKFLKEKKKAFRKIEKLYFLLFLASSPYYFKTRNKRFTEPFYFAIG